MIGWSIELAQVPAAGVRYFGMYLVSSGAFIMMPTLVVWLCTNLGKGVKRNVAMGLLTGFGNCGALISSNVFITSQAPHYPVGFGVGLAFGVVAGIAATVFFVYLLIINRRRDRISKATVSVPSLGEGMNDFADDQEDAHASFRFQL